MNSLFITGRNRNVVDWNEQYNAEKWRHSWEVHQNRYLEKNQRPERVDLRSFARQGIDLVPTVHMGPAVSAMEDKGIETDIGNLNRDIRRTNRLLNSLKKTLRSLFNWFSELRKQKNELIVLVKLFCNTCGLIISGGAYSSAHQEQAA